MSEQMPTIPETMNCRLNSRLGDPRLCLVLILGLLAGLCSAPHVQAQQMQVPMQAQMPGPGNSSPIPQMSVPGPPGPERVFQQRRIKAMNSQRQKELVSDTNKLLKLTTELNAQIGRGRGHAFTSEQLRMLARIEKLAKSVKEKMSNPIQLSTFQDGFPPLIAPVGMP